MAFVFDPFTGKLAFISPIRIFTAISDSSAVNTVTETSLIGSGIGSAIIPANSLTIGKDIHIKLGGYYSVTSPAPTLRICVKLNGTTILDTTANLTSPPVTNLYTDIEAHLTIRSVGVSGTATGYGGITLSTTHTSAYFDDFTPLLSPVAVDTTISNPVDVTATWGTANTLNSIIINNGFIELSH